MKELLEHVSTALGDALGQDVQVEAHRPVGGGCINHATRVDTNRGSFFMKYNRDPKSGLFSREALGLRALASSGTSLAVPEPITHRDPTPDAVGFLVTDYLEPGPPTPDFDERLGRGLAELHSASADAFGFDADNYCGLTTQPNPKSTRWVDFYREHRLRHLLKLGREQGIYGDSATRVFEAAFDRLEDHLPDDEPPALIHGDLWSGNLHVTSDGRPALIDPAVYYAHREAELGMMTLFGGFSDRVYAAYQEVRPLSPGWRDRNGLYQLYHLMNHAVLFAGAYVERSVELARRYA